MDYKEFDNIIHSAGAHSSPTSDDNDQQQLLSPRQRNSDRLSHLSHHFSKETLFQMFGHTLVDQPKVEIPKLHQRWLKSTLPESTTMVFEGGDQDDDQDGQKADTKVASYNELLSQLKLNLPDNDDDLKSL